MDNVISVLHSKENTIEFNLTMEGIELKDLEVKLMIEAKDMQLGFAASNKEGDTWIVRLPKLSMIEKTAYPFYIEVHADGYFFTPFKGTLDVVKSAEIYSSEPKNTTIQPKEEKKPAAPKKTKQKAATKKVQPKVESAAKTTEAKSESVDDKLKDILDSHHPAPKKRTKVDFSIEELANKLIAEKNGTTPPKTKTKSSEPMIEDSSFDEAARQIMESHKFDKAEIDKKIEEVKEAADKVDHTKDDRVIAILEEAGIRPKKKKRPRISFIKTKTIN